MLPEWVSHTRSNGTTSVATGQSEQVRPRHGPSSQAWKADGWQDGWNWWQWQGGTWIAAPLEEAVAIEFDPKALPWVTGQHNENLKRMQRWPGVESIEVKTRPGDGQFEGRIYKQAMLVVTAAKGALERVKQEVEKLERRVLTCSKPREDMKRRLHLVTSRDFQSMTFVKVDMQKCVCSFASFPNRQYLEVALMQSAPPRRTPPREHGTMVALVEKDCSLRHVEECVADLNACNKVTVRLGRLLYYGLSEKAKGVLEPEALGQLGPRDYRTQFSRHLLGSKEAASKILSALAWNLQSPCRQTKLRFTKQKADQQEADQHPLEVEVSFNTRFDPRRGACLPKILDVREKKQRLLSDFDFLDSSVSARLEIGTDQPLPDLKQDFASATFKDKQLHVGDALFKLDRISWTRQIAREPQGQAVLVWRECIDFFNGDQIPYETVELFSPALNEALEGGIAGAISEMKHLVHTVKDLVHHLPRNSSN